MNMTRTVAICFAVLSFSQEATATDAGRGIFDEGGIYEGTMVPDGLDLDGHWAIKLRVPFGENGERPVTVWLLAQRWVTGFWHESVLDATRLCKLDVHRFMGGVREADVSKAHVTPVQSLIMYDMHRDPGGAKSLWYGPICISVGMPRGSEMPQIVEYAMLDECQNWTRLQDYRPAWTRDVAFHLNVSAAVNVNSRDYLEGTAHRPGLGTQTLLWIADGSKVTSWDWSSRYERLPSRLVCAQAEISRPMTVDMLRVDASATCEQIVALMGD